MQKNKYFCTYPSFVGGREEKASEIERFLGYILDACGLPVTPLPKVGTPLPSIFFIWLFAEIIMNLYYYKTFPSSGFLSIALVTSID